MHAGPGDAQIMATKLRGLTADIQRAQLDDLRTLDLEHIDLLTTKALWFSISAPHLATLLLRPPTLIRGVSLLHSMSIFASALRSLHVTDYRFTEEDCRQPASGTFRP